MTEPLSRRQFLNVAALFEGGLAVVAFGLGWLADVDPLETFRPEWRAAAWGALAALPMFGLFSVSMYRPVGGLRTIRRFLLDHLAPYLEVCRWYDLLALALIAGFSEELLFRGVLQPWMSRPFGPFVGLVASNVVFGLAHFITPTYAVLAFVMGFWFGVLPEATSPPNLVVPIVTHAVYDWLAFLVVVAVHRRERAQ